MKKVILTFSAAMMFLASCEKTQIQTNEKLNASNEVFTTKATLRVYFDNGTFPGVDGVDYGCSGAGGNCQPDVVVVGGIADPVKDLYNAIGSHTVVHELFTDNETIFNEVFGEENVENVLNNVLTVSVRGSIYDTQTAYFVFKKNGTEFSVVPVRLS